MGSRVSTKSTFAPIPGASATGYFAISPIKNDPSAEARQTEVKEPSGPSLSAVRKALLTASQVAKNDIAHRQKSRHPADQLKIPSGVSFPELKILFCFFKKIHNIHPVAL